MSGLHEANLWLVRLPFEDDEALAPEDCAAEYEYVTDAHQRDKLLAQWGATVEDSWMHMRNVESLVAELVRVKETSMRLAVLDDQTIKNLGERLRIAEDLVARFMENK